MEKPIQRNTRGLREMLFAEIEAYQQGKIPPERLRILTNAAYALIDSARLDLEYMRISKTMKRPRKAALVKPPESLSLADAPTQ